MYQQLFILFAIIFAGFGLRKIGLIDAGMNAGVSKMVVYFAYPCLIIRLTGTMEIDSAILKDFLITFCLSVVCFAVYGTVSILYTKLRRMPRDEAAVMQTVMSTPNSGFMGMPVSLVFLGPPGLLLMIANVIATNIYQYTFDQAVLEAAEGEPPMTLKKFVKLIVNPNIVGIAAGLVICFSGISLDNAVGNFLETVGNIAIPLAMIFIGSTLAESSFKDVAADRRVYEASFIKLILLPLLTVLICLPLPVSQSVKAIVVLASCFPAAAVPVMLTGQAGKDAGFASRILFLSTVISMATLPVAMMLIQTRMLSA